MTNKSPILHIIVVGFHHKKGCQVEFSYPPLMPDNENAADCPTGWKYLPTLGLPDGSHNFYEDSVFFNLPSLVDPNESVYGVSCYRQIPVEKLKIRTADVTRSTVQKSVCILASIPVYGYIEVKLSLIAHAYFEQGDFACTGILTNAYKQLNACLSDGFLGVPSLHHIFVGLPLRDIVLRWRYKTLILFKLMLLQKRVVCFGSPVRPICSLILGIASLHPQQLEKGFQQVACVRTSRPMSPMPNFSQDIADQTSDQNNDDNKLFRSTISVEKADSFEETTDIIEKLDVKKNIDENDVYDKVEITPPLSERRSDKNSLPRDASVDALAISVDRMFPLCSVNPNVWAAPMQIFTNGNLCLPYLSLPYMDLLMDSSVHGYTIGTSNILFQQKKQLTDVFVDVEGGSIETANIDIRKQLTLTTEDLRFVDFIMRHVQAPKENAEGSEQWIREQFQGYMLAMLRTSLLPEGSKEPEHFNGYFMSTWKKGICYQQWFEHSKPADTVFENIPAGHPFAGNLSVTDVKLKIAQTMNNSESGRKINQAVNTTSKAVGGAISQAKGALSNWWSAITTQPAHTHTTTTDEDQRPLSNTEIDDFVLETNRINEEIGSNMLLIGPTELATDACAEPQQQLCNVINAVIVTSTDDEAPDKREFTSDCKNGDLVNVTNEGIVEIGHEAVAVLDTNRKSGEVFTV